MTFEKFDSEAPLSHPGNGERTHLQGKHVTVVGLGAVGAIAAQRLVAGGIGRLTLVDRDLVESRNLERPSLFGEGDLGDPKATAARARLRTITSAVRVEARVKDVHPGTVHTFVEQADVVVDGTDNLVTRYVLNEACIQHRIPFLYGAALGAHGMASPLYPPQTPCFRCLLPPPADMTPVEPCATGIARVAPRVGKLLASQALQFLGDGTLAAGLYLLYDGKPGVERVVVAPRPGCSACRHSPGEFLEVRQEPTVVQLCGGDAVSVDPGREEKIPLEQLAARLASVARVRLTPYLVSLNVPPYDLSVFPDGRAIIRGVRSPNVARAVYHRYVGLEVVRQPL